MFSKELLALPVRLASAKASTKNRIFTFEICAFVNIGFISLMKITLACITAAERRLRAEPAFALTADYLARASHYESAAFEAFPDEAALLSAIERRSGRSPVALILLDSRGTLLRSQDFAVTLGSLRDSGRQHVIAAIGPADGWSAAARARADLLLSLGRITLPHALAQTVLAEQIYRALTILAGHPYHCGH